MIFSNIYPFLQISNHPFFILSKPTFLPLFFICPCGLPPLSKTNSAKVSNFAKVETTNHPLFISILALTYPHFSFVLCSSFVRSLFVLCSSFVRSLFVFCSFFVRLFSICPCGSHRHFFICPCGSHRLLFIIPSSHFSVTTLPLLGRSLRIGEYVIGERIFCSYFHYLPVWLTPILIYQKFAIPLHY